MTNYSAVGRRSKTKGSSYELKTAKALSQWWGFTFNRTPASGGLHWGASNNVAGDIVTPIEADFPFVIECKKREDWTIDNVLLNNKDIKNWWSQVVGDALRVDKTPALIFSRNRASDYVMIPYDESLYDILVYKELPVMRTAITFEDIQTNPHKFDVLVTTMEGLVSFSPKMLKETYGIRGEKWEERTRLTESVVKEDTREIEEQVDDLISKMEK